MQELRAAFSKYNFLLTAALGAGKDTIDIAYDMKGLSLYLDYIHLMCYDYHGAWDMKTGANAPLRSNDVLNVVSEKKKCRVKRVTHIKNNKVVVNNLYSEKL